MAKEIEIIIAEPHGFCGNGGQFGVSGAIKIALAQAETHPGDVYILGELVHNQHVTRWLQDKYQIHTVNSLEEVPSGKILVIKSHGLPPQTIAAAQARGLQIVDATCPMVKQVHALAKKIAAEGKQIVYLASDLQHEEALGVYGEAPDQIQLVTLKDLPTLEISDPANTVLLSQTTLSILETKTALAELQARYPELKIQPHICPATTQRQTAVIALAQNVDLIIIVGSQTSSNSRRLQEVAAQQNKPAYIIDSPEEIDPVWFASPAVKKVGLSSGASTPEWILEAVQNKIKEIAATL